MTKTGNKRVRSESVISNKEKSSHNNDNTELLSDTDNEIASQSNDLRNFKAKAAEHARNTRLRAKVMLDRKKERLSQLLMEVYNALNKLL